MKRKMTCAGLSLALMLALASRPAWPAEKVPGDRLLPPNVHAYVTIPSVPEFKARWDRSLLGQLRQEEALADFWRDFSSQLDKVSGEIRKKLGVSLNDLLEIPSGEIAIALVQPPGKQLGVVGILDFGDSRPTIDKLLERAAKALADQGAKRSVKEVEETRIVVYEPAGEDGQGDEKTKSKYKLAYFVKDSYLVVGSNVDLLEAVLVRWDGKHQRTFADSEVYRDIVDRTKSKESDALLTWYVNPIGLVTAAVNSAGQDNLQAQMVLAFLPRLGLNQFKAVGGSLDLATKDYDSVSRVLTYVDLPANGVLGAFKFPAADLSPPKWISSKATAYFGLNWDLAAAYEAVGALVDSFQGPGTFDAIIEKFASNEQGPKLHPKKDVIDQLTGKIHLFSDLPNEDDPKSARFLVALGAKDAAKMKGLLAAIAKIPGFPGESREFRGHTLYELPIGAALGGGSATMGVAVAHGHLMIASNVTLLEQVIRADKDQVPLDESPEYRKIVEKMPAKTSVLAFQRQDAQIKAIYEMLRKGEAGELGLDLDVDFSKLPKFEVVQKYLPPTGSYAVPDRRGVLFVSFSLRGK